MANMMQHFDEAEVLEQKQIVVCCLASFSSRRRTVDVGNAP